MHNTMNARCNAVLSALENFRDAETESGVATITSILRVFEEAEGYVRDELSECTCGAETRQQLTERLAQLEEKIADQDDMLERQNSTNNVHGNRINELIREKRALEAEAADQREISRLHDSSAADLLQELNRVKAELGIVRNNYDADILTIGEALIEEAEDRGWCDEFDTFIDGLEPKLHAEMPRRVRDYDVYVEITVRVPVTVSARNADHARERAEEDWRDHWDSSLAAEHLENGTLRDSSEFDVYEA